MPQTLTDYGQRTDKDTGEVERVAYTWVKCSTYAECVDVDGSEAAVVEYRNRMKKTDARNTACAPKQTEEQKAAARERSKKMRELFAKVKANPNLAAELGIDIE